MKKMLFVYNPNAGQGRLKARLSEVLDIFVKAGYDEIMAYPTQSYKDAYRKVVNMEDGFDMVVCSGGDGTLDEVVTGMMKRGKDRRIPIGYIPTGTTNDFATSLGIPKVILDAADACVYGKPFACDVGDFNHDIFIYVAAFGLFTDVSYQTDQKLKNVIGQAAYLMEGMKRLANVPTYHIKITNGEQVIEDEFMIGLITNSRSVGGVKDIMGKEVDFSDGEFEVTLIRKPKNIADLNSILSSFVLGTFDSEYVSMFKTSHIILESEEAIPWTLDGEYGGTHVKAEIINKKQAVEIMLQWRGHG